MAQDDRAEENSSSSSDSSSSSSSSSDEDEPPPPTPSPAQPTTAKEGHQERRISHDGTGSGGDKRNNDGNVGGAGDERAFKARRLGSVGGGGPGGEGKRRKRRHGDFGQTIFQIELGASDERKVEANSDREHGTMGGAVPARPTSDGLRDRLEPTIATAMFDDQRDAEGPGKYRMPSGICC